MTKAKITPEFIRAYNRLNERQKEAVDSIEGPVMVIAGPGTGKTQILTLRIANILKETDTPPDAILALTFTESAAANMRRRLLSLVGKAAYRVHVHTFHSFANSVIQDYTDSFPRFIGASPLADVEKLILIANILDKGSYKELSPFYDNYAYVKDIMSAISSLKRDYINPEQLFQFLDKEETQIKSDENSYKKDGDLKEEAKRALKKIQRTKELAEIYKIYENTLIEEKYYDFEDMILELIRAMESDKDFKLQIQENFLYVLADEHQDANDAQNKLLELLTDFHDSPNLFIVGDEKQAIYRFQGASLQNFLYFKDKFKDTKVIELEDSYRSGQEILDASMSLMEKSEDKIKRVWLKSRANIQNALVQFFEYKTDEEEAAAVAKKIKNLLDDGVDPSEIAILYRTNADAEIFAKALAKEGVAFSIESDENVLDDKDIRKLIILLEAISDFGNDELLSRALHLDFLGIDELDLYKLIKAYRREEKKSLHEIALDEKYLSKLNLSNSKAVSVFVKRLKKYAKKAKNETVAELLGDIIEEFSYLSYILSLPYSLDILEKLRVLMKDAETIAQGRLDYSLSQFLEHLRLVQKHKLSISKKISSNFKKAVRLYTAHRAKGLEFEHVFIVKAYEGKWGSRRNQNKFILPVKDTSFAQSDADERRLFFVALTRAKLAVYISYAIYSEQGKERLPSKFIEEIDDKYKETVKDDAELDLVDFVKPVKKNQKSLWDLDYLRVLFEEQGLSVTALNNFLECPWKFFYSNLIRIPKMPTKYMLLGNAVHYLLYIVHEDAEKNVKKDKKELEELLYSYLKKRALSDKVLNETLELAKEYFFDWLSEYESEIGTRKTLNELEVNALFDTGLDELPKLKLTGKLDKVEFITDSTVRVVDYKTGKPKTRNHILGKTKAEDSGNYFRQLLFYKLLLDLDGRYTMKEGVIDFVQRKDNGKMVREVFDMESSEAQEGMQKLKEELSSTAKSIWNFDFWDKRCKKHEKGECEYCELRDLI